MFITSKYAGYNRSAQQIAGGLFLILLAREDVPLERDGMRAVVRYVRLRQTGHFMEGSVNVGPKHLLLSGAYGNMGLVVSVDVETWHRGFPVPEELYDQWNNGGGHNGVGSEGSSLQQWALKNLKALQGRARV